jgi:hypothetical protein
MRGKALSVMAGLVPAIHVGPCMAVERVDTAVSKKRPAPRLDDVDARDKPGHDGGQRSIRDADP